MPNRFVPGAPLASCAVLWSLVLAFLVVIVGIIWGMVANQPF